MKNDAKLFIYRSDCFVGTLSAPIDDEFSFVYDSEYCANGGAPLSLALPLQEEPVVGNVVYAYFDGLLPEGTERESLARYLQVSPLNTGEMLAALGGECIGDVVILTERLQELGYQNIDSGYQALNEETFRALVGPAPEIRLATEVANRISLAGAQSKIGLYYAYNAEDPSNNPLSDQLDRHVQRQNDIKNWFLPYGLAPSNCIVKPDSTRFAHLPVNEVYCLRLAQACGIKTAQAALILPDMPTAVIRRFDRLKDTTGTTLRMYQEDICQIVSISPVFKYQNDGGPGIDRLVDIIREHCVDPYNDLLRLMRLILFNYLIGNCDAHGKNFSLVGPNVNNLRLAPAYDLVSTTFYAGISRHMAMSIGENYDHDNVRASDISQMAKQAGISTALLKSLLEELARRIAETALPLAESILREGFPQALPIAKHIIQESKKSAATVM